MNISAEQLARCVGAPFDRAQMWLGPLSDAMGEFEINTPVRIGMFLANVAHESASLSAVRERWGPTPAQLRYEGRKDLGNVRPGDGRKYLGRGPLQVTGHANYVRLRDRLIERLDGLVPDFEQSPELLELPRWGSYAAGMYWHDRRLNLLADDGRFDAVCDVINIGHETEREGDSNGYASRLNYWHACKVTLAIV